MKDQTERTKEYIRLLESNIAFYRRQIAAVENDLRQARNFLVSQETKEMKTWKE